MRRMWSVWLVIATVAALALALVAWSAASKARPPVVSASGMEGLEEVAVQVHIAGDPDWRVLAGLDEQSLEARVRRLLEGTPNLRIVEGSAPLATPRVLVVAVGHVIADPAGERQTAATNLSISLNQQVSLIRPVGGGSPPVVTGMTWHHSILITGVIERMAERIEEKLAHLVASFREEHARENAPPDSGRGGA